MKGNIRKILTKYCDNKKINDRIEADLLILFDNSCSVPSDVIGLLETISNSDNPLYREKANDLLRKY